MSTDLTGRIAAAPISWGVCEVPDWGHQMAPSRVLAEMAELGLDATEFGPDGFLPPAAEDKRALLARHALRPVGGFVPAVLHHADHDPLPGIRDRLDGLRAAGAHTLILAAATGLDGYDSRPALDAAAQRALLDNLDRTASLAADHDVRATLHPHVGTMVESADEVDLVLAGSRIPLCLDTGHLLVGGTDPVELARRAAPRIGHVHLKDVDAAAARAVRHGRLRYARAVADGLFRPLGDGNVDVAALVHALERQNYAGWYVLEQDQMLPGEPPAEAGPIDDARRCLHYLRHLREAP